jgi:hypothetical protein
MFCSQISKKISTKSAFDKVTGRFVEQKLKLSSNFRCDQNYKNERYDFGHTLLCYLSPTWMFNKPTSEVGLLNI